MIVLNQNEIGDYYRKYVDQIVKYEQSLPDLLKRSLDEGFIFLKSIPIEKWDYFYAKDKWTIKEILQHLIDTERVFCYRALRFSRNDPQALPGFDQDAFVQGANTHNRKVESLIKEFKNLRTSTLDLFDSFNKTSLLKVGTASGTPMSVRAAGYIIVGHQHHHFKIIKERYL